MNYAADKMGEPWTVLNETMLLVIDLRADIYTSRPPRAMDQDFMYILCAYSFVICRSP